MASVTVAGYRPVVHWEPSRPLDADKCEMPRAVPSTAEEASAIDVVYDEEDTCHTEADTEADERAEPPRNQRESTASCSSHAEHDLDVRAVFLHIRNKAEASEFEPYPCLRIRSARRECSLELNGQALGFSEPMVVMLKRERTGCYICMERCV